MKTFNTLLYLFIVFFVVTFGFELFFIVRSRDIDLVIFQNSKLITQNILTINITVLGVLIAAHYVVFQVLRNRFPVRQLRDVVIKEVNQGIKHYTLNVLIALIIMLFKHDFQLLIIPYIMHTLYCFYLFVTSIREFLYMDSTSLLDNYKSEIIASIKKKPIELDGLKKHANNIKMLNEDSFSKQEIAICKYNLEICEEINIHFIKERDGLIISGSKEDEIQQIQLIFISTIISSMKIAISYQNYQYVESSISSIRKILRTCIDCDKYELFSSIVERMDEYFNYNQIRNNIRPCIGVVSLYGQMFQYIIENNKREDWIEYFISHLRIYTLKSTLHFDETMIKVLCSVYFENLEEFVDKKNITSYEDHLENVVLYIIQNVRVESSSVEKYVHALLGQHILFLIENEAEGHTRIFLEQIIKLCKFAIDHNNEDFYIFLTMSINKVIENSKSEELVNKLNESKFDLVLRVLKYDNEFTMISIPNYQEVISKSNYADNILGEVIEKFEVIFHRILLKKRNGMLLFMLQKFRSIIEDLNQQQRMQQQKLMGLFEQILHDSISINNKEGFYIILDEFVEIVEKLDRESRLSEGLMKFIIQIFSEMFTRCVKGNQNELTLNCINRLIGLQKKLLIVTGKTEIQKAIIEALFQVGLDAIENHNEDVICNVSNHLGWVGKNSIENSNTEILQFILSKATILYNISIDLEVNRKTVIFIGTLFVILGGYISSKKKGYLPLIMAHLNKLQDKRLLIKSRDLRLYESSKWNDMMDGNAKHHIELFSKQILDKSLNA